MWTSIQQPYFICGMSFFLEGYLFPNWFISYALGLFPVRLEPTGIAFPRRRLLYKLCSGTRMYHSGRYTVANLVCVYIYQRETHGHLIEEVTLMGGLQNSFGTLLSARNIQVQFIRPAWLVIRAAESKTSLAPGAL